MAKVNVNTASREDLVNIAGLRAEIADEILKFRHKHGRIAGPDTLEELQGVGPATVEQFRRSLDFGERGGDGGDKAARAASERESARAPSQAAGAAASLARDGLRMAQRAGEAQREAGLRSAESTTDLSQAFLDLVDAQARHNLAIWTALAGAVDWARVFELQSEYLQASVERAARLTQHYLEASQAAMNATVEATQDQARRAA